ncbi:3-phosphoshikimate 1-carboxyvinyltransferase [Bhargavaea beijingensis]|uniref:3-phosphoshikimate 1-carboxyvinyltransferase n=1 Tax=Bhargavaea beijingensis TaxID=426756 RepID=A0A1G7ALT4_9BACL|nr:3-phosphoshikimate 1-carboxyvinyltransferase [Bhargavaea beijingensis]SDE15437.1 3-phosphoshikimate 1-carboxyvinyltransferase [Bhargavaea beijingensis]
MDKMTLNDPQAPLRGTIAVPGDKSISHRAVMFGGMAKGRTTVSGFLPGEDCLRTIECFRLLGADISRTGTDLVIDSPGIDGWQEPADILYTGNSGTTTRLMLGILAGSRVHSVIAGDESIARRPMKRVTGPLQQMGADIRGRKGAQYTPVSVLGGPLRPIDYDMPVASAQVKSAILFAAMRAEGTSVIREKEVSRDHTERMMQNFGMRVQAEEGVITLQGGQELVPVHVDVPGDISSAAFFLAASALVPGSEVVLENVGLNPTRTGMIDVLEAMGTDFGVDVSRSDDSEIRGTVTIRSSSLKATEIGGDLIPRLIDEIPIIALLATQAEGTTVIRDAEELRVKETDRIAAVAEELGKLGADIIPTDDGMIINGPTKLSGAVLDSRGDHRIGMMAAVAALITDGPVELRGPGCIAISYPEFFEHLNNLRGN